MINNEKITNLIVYLSSKIEDLYITKLLKLIYLIDENAVKETGTSISDLEYKVWQHGPVNIDLYNSLSFSTPDINFENKIDVYDDGRGKIIKSISKFDNSEFSEYEIDLIDRIIHYYGHLSSSQLVDLLHAEGTLWYKIVEEKGLKSFFQNEENNTSPFNIDFFDLVKDSPVKSSVYQSAKESLMFQNSLV